MVAWPVFTHFVGFDWAKDHHDVVVVAKDGSIALVLRFDDAAEGWQKFTLELKKFPHVAIAIETSSGANVERLLEGGYGVYPVNPKSAERYRERKAPCGVKDDQLDAWSLADALRVDGHNWKCLGPQDAQIVELRQLCRDEIELIRQRTAFVNQLQEALRQYYPIALQAFDDWTRPSSWAFVQEFPTPQALEKAGKRKWEKFLHTHKLYRPETAAARLALFTRATEFCGTAPTTAAKSLLAVSTAKLLRTLEAQLAEYRVRIEALFDSHPDHDIFGSLPNSGKKLAPRLLGEIGSDRGRFESAEGLQCYAGTAPATYRSGNTCRANIRRACNKNLRYALHLFADLSRQKCTWADVYYQKTKEEGKHHATALRCLAQRWLKIIWKMWQTRKPYDGELHQRNQVEHGSWVMQLLTDSKTPATT